MPIVRSSLGDGTSSGVFVKSASYSDWILYSGARICQVDDTSREELRPSLAVARYFSPSKIHTSAKLPGVVFIGFSIRDTSLRHDDKSLCGNFPHNFGKTACVPDLNGIFGLCSKIPTSRDSIFYDLHVI